MEYWIEDSASRLSDGDILAPSGVTSPPMLPSVEPPLSSAFVADKDFCLSHKLSMEAESVRNSHVTVEGEKEEEEEEKANCETLPLIVGAAPVELTAESRLSKEAKP